MQGEDELLTFFSNEFSDKYEQYSKRMPIQQFKGLNPNRLRDEYYSLTKSHKILRKRAEIQALTSEIYDIDGNRIKSIIDDQVYGIFCSAPDSYSAKIFWPICYREKISKIYMILPRSATYWPALKEEIVNEKEKITIRCQKEEEVNEWLVKREIVMTMAQGERRLEHIHFKAWPDGDVPGAEQHCITYRQLIEDAIKAIDNKEIILIHCRAGIGRTGTMGATIEAVRCARLNKPLSLFQITANMRIFRDFCVQTPDQYRFIHQQTCKMIQKS